jgi:hypothetical protein
MIYVFSIRPVPRLLFVVVLCWVGEQALHTPAWPGAILMFILAAFITRGLLRFFYAYLRTWG